MPYLYLYHFDEPLAHASHYLGSTDNVLARLQRHRAGHGARLTQVLTELGRTWKLAATYEIKPSAPLTTKEIERLAKGRHNARQHCPLCNPNHTAPQWTRQIPNPKE